MSLSFSQIRFPSGTVWEPWAPNHRSRRISPPRATGSMDYDLIVSVENLVEVCKWLCARKSDAPGPDGVRLSQLTNQEIWALMRALSECLHDGTYRPGQAREVPIPKRSGGYRTIRIRGLFDRIVSAALHFALDSLIDPHFVPMSHCSRPGRGCMTLLAMMSFAVRQTGHQWLVNADVYHAFDEVPRTVAINSFLPFITCPNLLSLLEVVLHGDGGQPIGIDQGAALSALTFNTTMHSLFDLAMEQRAPPLTYRYLDNLVALCASETEAQTRLQEFTHVLSRGKLKTKEPTQEEPVIVDLRAASTVLLGFELSTRDGLLQLAIAESTWESLEHNLRDTFSKHASPTATASQLCRSWCAYFAPGLHDPDAAVHRIAAILRSYGVREGITQAQLRDAITQAQLTWAELLDHTAAEYLSVVPPEELRSGEYLRGPLPPAETEPPTAGPSPCWPSGHWGFYCANIRGRTVSLSHSTEVEPQCV